MQNLPQFLQFVLYININEPEINVAILTQLAINTISSDLSNWVPEILVRIFPDPTNLLVLCY